MTSDGRLKPLGDGRSPRYDNAGCLILMRQRGRESATAQRSIIS